MNTKKIFFAFFIISMLSTVYSRALEKRELQEVEDNEALYTSHGNYGGGSGGGHGHATSYQSYVLHAFHPSKFHVKEH
ncbi:Hypothetical protein CINCED_3A023449 [Cinara cedri]|uniref:Uncharacterized protein n=1 Tax=Cinara cedri TaxID=506608 RepID=A0A5E4M1Q5_9HEMI|nr:Hypothetical protein CINCED_3A023449 [Cinara cedri]